MTVGVGASALYDSPLEETHLRWLATTAAVAVVDVAPVFIVLLSLLGPARPSPRRLLGYATAAFTLAAVWRGAAFDLFEAAWNEQESGWKRIAPNLLEDVPGTVSTTLAMAFTMWIGHDTLQRGWSVESRSKLPRRLLAVVVLAAVSGVVVHLGGRLADAVAPSKWLHDRGRKALGDGAQRKRALGQLGVACARGYADACTSLRDHFSAPEQSDPERAKAFAWAACLAEPADCTSRRFAGRKLVETVFQACSTSQGDGSAGARSVPASCEENCRAGIVRLDAESKFKLMKRVREACEGGVPAACEVLEHEARGLVARGIFERSPAWLVTQAADARRRCQAADQR
jgi:hypothetical protein